MAPPLAASPVWVCTQSRPSEGEHHKNNLPDCLAELRAIEQEILQGIEELEGMLR